MSPLSRKIIVVAVLAVFLVSGCAYKNVRVATFDKPLDRQGDAHPAPIQFRSVRPALPAGAELGVYRGGCSLSYEYVGREFFNGVHQPDFEDHFAMALEAQGYDVIDQKSAIFAEEYEDDLLRSEYSISGKIVDADISICRYDDMVLGTQSWGLHLLGSKGSRGKVYLKIEWGVYDNLRREVVYKTATEGYVNRKVANIEGANLMVMEAFSMAAHNLGADRVLHDLIFFEQDVPKNQQVQKTEDKRPRQFDGQEAVFIQNKPLSQELLPQHIEHSRRVSVLVQAGGGHGSGYFITKQGHILTNKHVVGDARRVRIVTANQKEELIAEVLRTSPKRDVALLRLESVPPDLDIVTLPMKTEWPKVSEEIYALGAPSHYRMQDTLSKGIVSAHRRNFRVFGAEMDFIQGDVQTIGGNSGGPLLDANGNIVGMSVVGLYNQIGESDSGLNVFIPIEDALKHLDITLE